MTPDPDTTALLGLLRRDDDEHLAALRSHLAPTAAATGLVDLSYCTVDTPIGPLLLVASGRGLVRVAFQREDHDAVLADLAHRVSPRILEHHRPLDPVARQLADYFDGKRTAFEVDLDWSLTKGFRAQVLRHLTDIAYGHTASYATVARLAGNPKAVRAVGTACATNPLPIVVPCHRVVRSDGSMGGYLGGAETKAVLLALEAA